MKADAIKCPTCGYRQKRSSEANRRYWSIINAISQGLKLEDGLHSPQSWHLYMKLKFLGADDFRLPSGEIIIQPRSSADLDTAQFHVFQEQVEHWAGEQGIWLDD